MDEFAKWVNARRDFELLANFRSSEPVITHAERLLPHDPPMSACGDAAVFTEEPLYIHADTAFDAIVGYFIPDLDELGIDYGKAAILAPWWVKLLYLGRQLRARGIPIVGPGARPYKRSAHLFAPLAEQVCAYIEKPDPKRIPRVERDLFRLLTNVTGSANFNVYTYRGRKTVFELVRAGQILRKEHDAGLIWLKEAAREFTSILCGEEFLPRSSSHFLIESVNDMESDMVKRGVDVASLTIADLGMFADYEGSIKLLTMHRAKGREFDAVAIVDLHEGRVPHFKARTVEEVEEARRVLYVSITRARRILMYITDEEHPRNRPSRFLFKDGLGLV
jgi:DNA helicase-2/ATP-dependent DNA helicase PcrA